MAQPSVLSTLQHVTNIKLGKVAHRQRAFEDKKAILLAKAASQSTLAAQTLVLADDAIRRGTPEAALGIAPGMLKHFVQQSSFDPTVSRVQIETWNERLKQTLDCQSRRHRLTSLFGQLVMEYLNNPNSANTTTKSASTEDYEQVGRAEMHEQRRQWERYAFAVRNTDEAAIDGYLTDLFDANNTRKTHGATPLEELRSSMKNFNIPRMDSDDVEVCIKTLLKADLFAGDKREALVSMQSMASLCSEVSDCLNSDLAFIGDWEWDNVPILLHQRRQLNGKYRVYMDEEIYQAILIQYIGLHWASHCKNSFKAFQRSSAWLHAVRRPMTKEDRERREYFLNEWKNSPNCLHDRQKRIFKDVYFCTQLPDHALQSSAGGYGDDDDTDSDEEAKADVKQTILRQVATESIINTKLRGDFTVLQSDFKWFGPSLPHTTINAVLRFMHVPDQWLSFFHKFLKVPLAFVQDGEQGATHERQSGIPMSHTLADAMGEAVLFTLDYGINRRTGGANLVRFYDDLWVWGSNEHCEKAWAALNEFCSVTGLQLNLEKTGTVVMYDASVAKSKPAASAVLPNGKVTWGFLHLVESGKWEIDQAEVDKHIDELRRQLSACRSVMAFVNAYNAYVGKFMVNNFGKPAECLGRPHIEDAIKTISRVNKEIFSDTYGDAAQYLRGLISTRFGVADDLPDGFFYFPQSIGGLGLQNPLLALQLQWREAEEEEPDKLVDKLWDKEAAKWSKAKEDFEMKQSGAGFGKRPSSVGDGEGFMSLDEYLRYPELRSALLGGNFGKLMEELDMASADVSTELQSLAGSVPSLHGGAMSAALQLYGHGVLDYCGNVRLGEEEMLPVGLLDMLQSEKFRWQG